MEKKVFSRYAFLGFVSFAGSFLVLIFSYYAVYRSINLVASGLGSAFSLFTIFSIIALIYKFIRRNPAKPVIYYLTVSWIFAVLLSLLFLVKDLDKVAREKEIASTMVNVIDSVTSGSNPDDPKNQLNDDPLALWFRDHLSEMKKINTEYSSMINNVNLEFILSSENLLDRSTAENSLMISTNLVDMVTYYEVALIEQLNKAASTFPHGGDGATKGTYNSFVKSMETGKKSIMDLSQTRRKLFRAVSEIINLVLQEQDRISISDGSLVFYDSKTLDLYNNLIDEIQMTAEQEMRIVNQIQFRQENRRQKVENLKKELN